MQKLSNLTETVLSNKITRNKIVPSFKDSPRKPLRRRGDLIQYQYAFANGGGAKILIATDGILG